MGKLRDMQGHLFCCGFVDSRLGRFAAVVDLQKMFWILSILPARWSNSAHQFYGIDAVNQIKQTDGVFGFIALEVPDEMPLNVSVAQ
jgi:hypothetical protein